MQWEVLRARVPRQHRRWCSSATRSRRSTPSAAATSSPTWRRAPRRPSRGHARHATGAATPPLLDALRAPARRRGARRPADRRAPGRGRPAPARRLTGAGAPLRVRQARPAPGTGRSAAGCPRSARCAPRVADDVAADVVGLLDRRRPGCTAGAVEPGDVAVLVRTNAQGALVREALARAGVPAVLAGGGSVFATPSARDWLRAAARRSSSRTGPAGCARRRCRCSSAGPRPRSTRTATRWPTGSARGCAAGPTCSPSAASRRFLEVLSAQERLPERGARPPGRRAAAHRPAPRRAGRCTPPRCRSSSG